jgi:hypothetical protein
MALEEGQTRPLIRQKIADALAVPIPAYTHRDVHLPNIRGKARVVIGMRRSGKTTFLWQCLAERLAVGTPREALLYFSFEDERLGDMKTSDLQWIIEARVSRPSGRCVPDSHGFIAYRFRTPADGESTKGLSR